MIEYTIHASLRMRGRGISKEMVEKALKEPDRRTTGYKNRDIVYKKFPEGTIKIVYTPEEGKYIIISVMWD